MTRHRREQPDPYQGRFVVDFVYSLGRRVALEDPDAQPLFDAIESRAISSTQRAALRDQFKAGIRDEKRCGVHAVESAPASQ